MPVITPIEEACDACDALAGRDPHDSWVLVYRGTGAAVYVTDRQRSRGSMLVLPVEHAERLSLVSARCSADLFYLVRDTVKAVRAVFSPVGLHVWTGTGVPAGQSMAHMHFQIVPRYEGEPYSYEPSSELPATPIAERVTQAEMIRARL